MRELLFKVGDTVRVRPDLELGVRYFMLSGPLNKYGELSGDMVVYEMAELAGKEVTIIKIATVSNGGKEYIVNEAPGYFWTDDMFERQNECYCKSLL